MGRQNWSLNDTMTDNYGHGSEWRRWDLHIHTPGTLKNDKFKETPNEQMSEKWNNYYKKMHDYVGDGSDPVKAIAVIGITDYYSVDNYKKVKGDHEQGFLPSTIKLVLPNIEMRMLPVGKLAPVNIHCIFSPELSPEEIESRFLSKLKNDTKKATALKSELIRFGRDLSEDNLDESSALKRGIGEFVVTTNSIEDVFKEDPALRGQCIVVVSNSSNDGASFPKDSQTDHTKKMIYRMSDAIFTSRQNDVDFFLGKGPLNEDDVKKTFGSLKPCIHGCDAHELGKIFCPDEDRFCWIKADTTFEGLKQILYEPQSRVKISPVYPDKKQDYCVIDRVEMIGEAFSPKPIMFSDKLTCIIGGKSTGKSLLLNSMADAIDTNQVKKKLEKTPSGPIHPKARIHWRDNNGSETSVLRKITYIPQSYLNRLSDVKGEATEIDILIQEVIHQDPRAKKSYESRNEIVSTLKTDNNDLIQRIINTNNNIKDTKNKMLEIGDRVTIERGIKKYEEQFDALSKSLQITEEDIKSYTENNKRIQELMFENESLEKDRITVDAMNSVMDIVGEVASAYVNSVKARLHATSVPEMFADSVKITFEVADKQWKEKRKEMIEFIANKLSGNNEEIECKNKILNELKPKIEQSEQLNSLTQTIKHEQKKILDLKPLEETLLALQQSYESMGDKLSNSFGKFKQMYEEYAVSINDKRFDTDGLMFKVETVFRKDAFAAEVVEVIDNRTVGRFEPIKLSDVDESQLLPDSLKKLINSIMGTSEDSVQLKGRYDTESALKGLFTDWYQNSYNVTMGRDKIGDMSPGKKALVLLKLLLNLSDSDWPILIDQPEDDLDNRSIFDELILFIKEKKIKRQIIVVTHNANIVLGGDAEQVIVANQDGTNSPNERYRFEYRCGAIENNMPILKADGEKTKGILNSKGIQQHICSILEGGEQAFELRKQKYNLRP